MHYVTALTATAFTLVTLLQLCPAPPLAAIGIGAAEASTLVGGLGGGAIAGGIGAATNKKKSSRLARRQDPLAGMDLPEQAANDCRNQLHSATVHVSPVDNNGVRFDGVPPACMTLATVFLGNNPAGQPAPIPMGSASLQYENLSPDELQTLQNVLDTKGNH